MTDTIKKLQEVRDSILSEIDGGEECRGWDSQLTQWAATIDAVIAGVEKPALTPEQKGEQPHD